MNRSRSLLRRLLLSLTFAQGVIIAHAQSIPKFDVKNILATSPEAAMLGRFGEIPIGYYTGTADVSIPLYSIKEGGLEVPIVLRYHGSGNKVEDQASNVGLGWSLEPGGAIIQVVNGKDDASDQLVYTDGYNFLKNTDPGYPTITTPFSPRYTDRYPYGNGLFSSNCIIPSADQDTYTTLSYLQQGHGQPDIYQYSFPGGYSGKFYVNPENGNVVLIDKKQDITFTGGGGGWTAKTMDGNTYYFNVRETAGPSGDLSTLNGITFKLSKIVLHTGKEINFAYQDGYYIWNQYSETFHSSYPGGLNDGYDNTIVPTSTAIAHHVKTLTSITGNNITVNFNLGSRSDMPVNTGSDPNVQRINSVDIRNSTTGSLIKSFAFNYDYFTSSGTDSYNDPHTPGVTYLAPDADSKRLKLLSVQETGYNAVGQASVNPPYVFAYDESVPFPLKTSYSKDFWGYYNGQSNNKLLPDLSFFYYSDDPAFQYPSVMPVGLLTSYQGANRSPDSTKMKMGLLKKVTYPTGGSTAFAYEPHNFGNHAYPDIQKIRNAPQQVYVYDTNQSGDVKTANFTVPTNQSVTLYVSITRGPNTSVTYDDMQTSNVTLTQTVGGVTSTVKTWQLFVDDRTTFDTNGGIYFSGPDATVVLQAGVSYTLTCNLPDALGPQGTASNAASVSASFSYLNFPPNYMNSYGAGMRISTIINYSANGSVANKKAIKYLNADNTPSGVLMSPLAWLYNEMVFSIVNMPGIAANSVADKIAVWRIASESAVPFSDGAQGNLVGYSRVEEDDVAPDNSTNGRHIYNYYNAASQWALNVPDNPSPLNGMIDNEEIYRNNSTVPIQRTTYTYASLGNTAFSGYKTSPTYVGDLNGYCTPTYMGGSADWRDFGHNFLIHFYPIYGYWYKPVTKLTENTENGVTASVTETYAYNTKGQLIQTDSYNSKQQKRSIKNLYPIDNPGNPMSAQLISLGLYDNLQQQKVMQNDNVELSRSNVDYRIENSQAVQSDITRSNNGLSSYTEVTFDKYLPFKTLYQFTEKSSPVCLLWSFNYTKPIAEIKNIDHATLESIVSLANIQSFAANPNPSATDINNFLAPIKSSSLLNKSLITSYAYDLSGNLTSQTDAKGLTTYYEYDSFQRLMNIKNKDGNIIKHIDYHYANQ